MSTDPADDTKPSVRCVAVKFADHETESPLDVICYSGDRCPYMNITALEEEIKSKDRDPGTEGASTTFTETALAKPTMYD